ncbi:MAG: FAD-dependent protein [Chitinophagaceae bacterium]
MIKDITLRLLPSEAVDDNSIKNAIAQATAAKRAAITGYYIVKQSMDARGRTVWINLTLKAFIDEPFRKRALSPLNFRDVANARHRVIIIGAGPAGLFAALQLIELGIQPVILERGKDVRARRRDLAILNKEGVVNPESNYCFGEGGAGTYSDGKLYTRSTKRGNINRILEILFHFGAEENVLYDAHPHIGTNKLPQIITAMRQQITDSGSLFLFEKKVVDFVVDKEEITAVKTADGDTIKGDAVILATGHSARDIFELLHQKNIQIEAKPFALGVRIEHPQTIIDTVQYHCNVRGELLPPASYSMVQQVESRGVFSFCMCPGGIIAPAATNPGELVVNGWSPSKRNNPYANSGMVVQVELQDAAKGWSSVNSQWSMVNEENGGVQRSAPGVQPNPLLMMHFQRMVEMAAFNAGGGKFVAPATRMVDFVNGKTSSTLPACSYLPGIASADLGNVLPPFIKYSLQEGFKAFGKKMKGYLTNDAVVVATESRTSSPIRIPRNADSLQHPQVHNLYPCGEGAGYAGGIVSAAIDGERVAMMLAQKLGVEIPSHQN